MSCYLWKLYIENDVDQFRQLLEASSYISKPQGQRGNAISGGNSSVTKAGGSKVALASSPQSTSKSYKGIGWISAKVNNSHSSLTLTRADVNSRDDNGNTILHYAASSTLKSEIPLALALVDHPLIDLYIQDLESGWTVLHRALYSGNITIARTIIERNVRDTLGISTGVASHNVEGIIKVKDREGNSPFDLFAATTTARLLVNTNITRGNTDETEEESDSADGQSSGNDSYDGTMSGQVNIQGDEVFAFGSNKNLSLGFGDEDDRQYPERISLKRPAHLLQRFYREDRGKPQQISISHLDNDTSLASDEALPKLPSSLPAIIQNRPLIIQDVALSKLHSAIVTTDPESNLYICGFGPGGRLGTGDETTRFSYVCIESGGLAGKKVISVALGQNHTLAVSHEGEVFTWGVNTFGQLGYALPAPALKDQEPIQLTPRQIFGSLRKETVTGIAASRIHSVVFTQSSLFTFGKNEGQLGLVDSDARSLEIQVAPRKVAASLFTAPIHMVTAIERATICLLESHEIWVFANYGYTKVVFPIEAFIDYALPSTAPAQYRREMLRNMRRQTTPNHICKIASGGDTICAMSRMGDVFSMTVTQQLEPGPTASSTTNPTKIRNGLSPLQRVWSPKKGHMAVRDVGVGQDGSIIICTESGSVWRRVKRVKIKDANAYSGHTKPKDYKFQRVPGLTRIAAVRSNPFGAYAAIRKDSDVTRSQVRVDKQTIWNDFAPLISIDGFRIPEEDSDAENPRMRFWAPATSTAGSHPLKTALRNSTDVEADLHEYISSNVNDTNSPYDVEIRTTLSDVSIPSHRVMLSSRSRVLRHALTETSRAGSFVIPDLLSMQKDEAGKIQVVFHGLDFLSILNVVLYVYLDIVLDVWHYIHHAPKSAFRYRQARTELMRVAGRLELRLEPAVRTMVDPTKSLAADMERAISDPIFFDDADVIVELAGQEARVHSVLMCQRCPFFEGLFKGRAAGRWLSNRRDLAEDPTDVVRVDLKHVEPATFSLILRHLYADTGEELFRDIVTSNLDEFLDLIIEVMSIANELMLDRLSQICQKVLGGYVNLRNACQLLNAVAPCSVTEFKDATLEYLCMNLEAMLEGHLLDELDEDLLLELDQVVRDNQLAFLPIAKSGRAEDLLHEKYPELAATIERGRQAKIQSLAAEIRQREENVWRRPSKDASLIPQSPNLKSKTSAADLMFDMDDDEAMLGKRNNLRTSQQESLPRGYESRTQSITNLTGPSPHSIDVNAQHDVNGKVTVPSEDGSIGSPSPMLGPPLVSSSSKPTTNPGDLPSKSGSMRSTPWDTGTVPLTKLDLKEIMAQTSSSRPSNIALGLSLESKRDEVGSKSFASRTSQKERKKHQFQQQQKQPMVETPIPSTPENIAPVEKPKSPWQTASPSPKVSLKDVLDPQQKGSSPSPRSTSNTRLNLRQTVANNGAATRKLSTPSASSATAQHRSVSTPNVPKPNTGQSSPSTPPQPAAPSSTRPSTTTRTVSTPTASLPIQSIRYQPPANAEPSLQLSMADILTQQQLEKDVIRDAVAKRSLQEIQQEQEFQEWWDLESRKVREEEEEMAKEKTRGDKDERGGRGKRSGRGDVRGSRGRGRGRGRGTGADRGRFSERSVI